MHGGGMEPRKPNKIKEQLKDDIIKDVRSLSSNFKKDCFKNNIIKVIRTGF